jgi:hypothetical protein
MRGWRSAQEKSEYNFSERAIQRRLVKAENWIGKNVEKTPAA